MARIRELGKDPLTWSFVKLFGCHVARNLRDFEGLPGSHGWRWQASRLWHARLLTKAQCSGVVVSVVERSERVEFLVDDGTALVKAVLWGEGLHAPVALGDLVHVEGKLNVDRNWDATEPSRELRVLRISKIEDPNEELLHWTQVMELVGTYYSAAGQPHDSQIELGADSQEVQWEEVATEAFFSLRICPSTKQYFLSRSDHSPSDDVLVETLEEFLLQQRGDDMHPLRITFGDYIAEAGCDADQTKRQCEFSSKNKSIRSLQNIFRKLSRAGLLFLEDDVADRHILLSFELVLKPALLKALQDQKLGISIAEIADAMISQQRFQWIPLRWIETGLERLLASQLAVQAEDSQLFFISS